MRANELNLSFPNGMMDKVVNMSKSILDKIEETQLVSHVNNVVGPGAPGGPSSPGESSRTTLLIIVVCTTAIVIAVAVAAAAVCFVVYRRSRQNQTHGAPNGNHYNAAPGMLHAQVRYKNTSGGGGDSGYATEPTVSTRKIVGNSTFSNNEIVIDPAILAMKIDFESIQPQECIGQGGYGEVYKGLLHGKTVVAIKRLLPDTRKNPQHIQNLLAEIKLAVTMEHPNIVEFIGVAYDSLINLCAIQEFMSGGDLRSLLQQWHLQNKPLGFDKRKATIAFDVANALTYMHSLSPSVLHRDLKSRNVLLDGQQLHAKVTDFGVSREVDAETMTAGVGSHLWMAPEVMMGQRYDVKADMFSFGVLLTELDSHELPYANFQSRDGNGSDSRSRSGSGGRIPDAVLLQRVAMGQIQARFVGAVEGTEPIMEFGRRCLSLDPAERPTAPELCYALQQAMRVLQ